MSIQIRDYQSADTVAVDRIALAAWEQYRPAFSDWARSTVSLARAAHFAKETELLVAEDDDLVVGFVCYVGPGRDREDIFDPSWALVRLLSVDPVARGRGLGARCLKRPSSALDGTVHRSLRCTRRL